MEHNHWSVGLGSFKAMGIASPPQDGCWPHAAFCCCSSRWSQAVVLFLRFSQRMPCSSTCWCQPAPSREHQPLPHSPCRPLRAGEGFQRQLGPAQTLWLRLQALRGALGAFSLILLLSPGKSVMSAAHPWEAAPFTEKCLFFLLSASCTSW